MGRVPFIGGRMKREKIAGNFSAVVDSDDDEEAWLKARRRILTASDVAVVLGLYGSRLALWYEKTGRADRQFREAEYTNMGHRLEPTVQRLFEEDTGYKTVREQRLLVSSKYPWLGATLDAWFKHPERRLWCPLEAKATCVAGNWPDSDSQISDGCTQTLNEPSLLYQVQLQSQMIVTDRPAGALGCLLGSPAMRFRQRVFDAHAGIRELILRETKKFAECIFSDTPPEADDSDALANSLRSLALTPGKRVELSASESSWFTEMQSLQAQERDVQKRIALLKNRIMARMGDAEVASFPNDKFGFTFREVKRSAYSVPDATYRTLRVCKNVSSK